MPNTFWKQKERRIARKYFGVERNPIDGSHKADCENNWLVVEMFNHTIPEFVVRGLDLREPILQAIPNYLVTELEQAIDCGCDGKLSIVVWSQKRNRDDESIVLLRKPDAEEWLGLSEQMHHTTWKDSQYTLILFPITEWAEWFGV